MPLTKLNNKAVANVTSIPVALGDMVFISSATASSSASIEFSLGNYKEYQFYFVNIHPSTQSDFTFNMSTDNGSNYNVTKTSTVFRAYNNPNDGVTSLAYDTGADLAQSTGEQITTSASDLGTDNIDNLSGKLCLFNPSSTTYVKHYISNINYIDYENITLNCFISGYCNTTSALTNIRFKMSSGNIDAGKILMFGIN
jgi:hypothetical protein